MDVDEFRSREQAAVGELTERLGREVVGKLDRLLLRDLALQRVEPPDGHRLLVTLASGQGTGAGSAEELQRSARGPLDRLTGVLDAGGASVLERYWLTHTVLATLSTDQVAELAAREDVAHLASTKMHWSTRLAPAGPAGEPGDAPRAVGHDGSGVRVGMLDSGVAADHPALAGSVVDQQDFTGGGTGDAHGHGTYCAGIVAGREPAHLGVAPKATLVDLKCVNYLGSSEPQMILAAVQAAVTAGVAVACCPFGLSHFGSHWSDPAAADGADGGCVLCTAVDNAVGTGIAFVVSVGNDGDDPCSTYDTHVNCPAMARSAITVGAADGEGRVPSFSSVGPTPDGRPKPDLVAPGVDVVSCRPPGTGLGSAVDEGYTRNSGTSPAAAYVTGVIAQMLAKNPDLAPDAIKSILTGTAAPARAGAEAAGAGVVDPAAALAATPE